MGSIKKEGSTWYFVAELGLDPLTRKRKRKKQRGFKTKKDAEKGLALVEAEVYKGVYLEPSTIYFKDYLVDWFKIKRNSVGIQTAEVYDGYIQNRIIPPLGHIQLSKLTPMLLQGYVNDLKEGGLASGTIKKLYTIVKGSLDHAVNMGLLVSNPITKVQIPKDEKKEMTVWNVDEVKVFLKNASNDRLYTAFHLAVTTGMRRGEILGLRWKDVDLNKGMVSVRQTLSKDGKQFLKGAKTDSSIRTIKLSAETTSVLKKQKTMIAKEKLQGGVEYNNYDLVVCTSKGTPINPANVKRTFTRLIQEANLPRIRFHDLRHTHATMLLSQGVHAKIVSERLGHSNIKMTLDTYSHVLPNMQEEAANQIDMLFKESN